jgi:O-succinylhomoserine sulfhydrylase
VFADEEEAFIYSRFSNPNYRELVDKMCELEGTEDGVAVASGMSAIFTTFGALLESGDEIVSSRSLFGSTHKVLTQILPKWGITCNYAEMDDPATWEEAITEDTRLLYVESPSNPTLDCIDLAWLADLCEREDLIYVVDNIFATPILQQPAEYGADIVVHSATKYIDGQGRGIGGVILGTEELMEEVSGFARHTGPSLSPFNAWMFSKSLETLGVRVREHSRIAREVAEYLEDHPDVRYVLYPHLESHPQYEIAKKQMSAGGGMVTFVL